MLTRYRLSTPSENEKDQPHLDFACFSALGRPRLWEDTLERAQEAFSGPHEGPVDLTDKVYTVQRRLARWVGSLLETDKPDVALTALRITSQHAPEHASLDVVTAGPGRVYLYRKGEPVRLSPRKEPPDGVLRDRPVVSQSTLETGDILLLGSVSSFSVRSMAQVAATLSEAWNTPASTLVQQLVGPAERNQVGAGALAIRWD